MFISSWGRVTQYKTASISDEKKKTQSYLTVGNLRSYGDQPYSSKTKLNLLNNKIIAFNGVGGWIEAESGALLQDIRSVVISHGFDLIVVPGTSLVTIGGAISNDIHGKSHHINGSFGNTLISIKVSIDNKIKTCSPAGNTGLFKAVIAGMGLIGEIVSAKIKVTKTSKLNYEVDSFTFNKIDDFYRLAKKSHDYSDSVAWFDCKDRHCRGIFFRGKRTDRQIKPSLTINFSYPFNQKFSLINSLTTGLFNRLYYYRHFFFPANKKLVSHESFHHPLDKILGWNKVYGSKGFYQFQCVIPEDYEKVGIKSIMAAIRKSKQGTFLSVLKKFGPIKSLGYLSFPLCGTTLAIDFPNLGPKTTRLMDELYLIALEYNGRIYPAKDSLMTERQFKMSFPNYKIFMKYRNKNIISEMSKRYNI